MMPGAYIPSAYLPILLTLIFSIVFIIACLTIGKLFRLSIPYDEKNSTYESGNPPVGDTRERFSMKFYVVAILFVVFDVEAIFLFPWAVSFDNLSNAGFWSMVIFILIVFAGFIYDWNKGALDWGRIQRNNGGKGLK